MRGDSIRHVECKGLQRDERNGIQMLPENGI